MYTLKRLSVITGHYGSGKTNIAVNMAIELKKLHEKVTIVDLDIVNPYFRTADFKEMLENTGIRVIAPIYANTNLDIPALPPDINSIFSDGEAYCIVDVGGDDAGAIALGQFAERIKSCDYDFFYVINMRRYLTNDAESAVGLLNDIQRASRLNATAIINNTNLGVLTTADTLAASKKYAEETAAKAKLPIAFSCLDRKLVKTEADDIMPIDIYVTTI